MAKKFKIFIDGREGTTGLRIDERLAARGDAELMEIPSELRKDAAERAKYINSADYVFLCLPDAAAIEAAALCENPDTVIIDASTAHRTNPDWVYGLPELSQEQRARIASSKRIAVPGCYASGFVMLTRPLVAAGILPEDYPAVCHAVSGYSGAGKKAIAQYGDPARDASLESPRLYALTNQHKHLPEMQKLSGLGFAPVFNPYICDYYAGMTVTVPLHTRLLRGVSGPDDVREAYRRHYGESRFIRVLGEDGAPAVKSGFIDASTMAGLDYAEIIVTGCAERVNVIARFDNLGKGASGAAVQCFNISSGADEGEGLAL